MRSGDEKSKSQAPGSREEPRPKPEARRGPEGLESERGSRCDGEWREASATRANQGRSNRIKPKSKPQGPNRRRDGEMGCRRDGDLRGLKVRGGAGVTVRGGKPALLGRIKVDQTIEER